MSFSISYSFLAIDKFSAVANKIKRSTQNISRSMKVLGRKVGEVGNKMIGLGKSMALKLTAPIVLFGGLALRAFNKQAQAVEQVKVGIKATGGAAKLTLQELEKVATSLQKNTLFGDEEILAGATAQLLTFTNITGKEFLRTQKVALDVATRLAAAKGGAVDLTSTSIMLGKALNDPVKNLGALGRSGIQFSEKQIAVIKHLSKTGRVAQAQKLILKELEKQYGGSAAAAAKAGTGGITQLTNLIGDLFESIGEVINEMLKPFVIKMKEVVNAAIKWVELNPRIAKIAIIIAGVVAALGPLLIGLGLLVKVVGVMMIGFGFLFSTVGLVIGAIALLGVGIFFLIKHWDELKSFMVGNVLGAITVVTTAWTNLKNTITIGVVNGFNSLSKSISALADGAMSFLGDKINFLMDKWKSFVDVIKNNPITNFFKSPIGALKTGIKDLFGAGETPTLKPNLSTLRASTDLPLNVSELRTPTSPPPVPQMDPNFLFAKNENKNTFDGNLAININDRNQNVRSAEFSQAGPLNVGISGVGGL